MPKLAKPQPKTKPAAQKKPSTRSKTGKSECSAAASNWQLSLRGKAALNPETYQTLAKCRALSSTKKKADAYGRTGKLSDMGAAALASRADKRFDQGLVTQKSRTDRLNILLKQRSERGKLAAPKAEPKPVDILTAPRTPNYPPDTAIVNLPLDKRGGGSINSQLDRYKRDQQRAAKQKQKDDRKQFDEAKYEAQKLYQTHGKALIDSTVAKHGVKASEAKKSVEGMVKWEPQKARDMLTRFQKEQEAKQAPTPTRYSLGGKLAPGRGTEERKKVAGIVRSLRTGDAQTAAGTLKAAGLVAIPSKYDAKKVAIKERDLWNAYTPREAAYRVLATRTLAGSQRKKKHMLRLGWVTP